MLESILQDRLKSKNGFSEARRCLKAQKQVALEKQFSQFNAAINVLKHGLGESYEALLKHKQLPFRIKHPGEAFFFEGRLHFGLGSVILLVNVILLSLYSLSCHSLRHLLGGNIDCFSCVAGGNTRYGLWKGLSVLNKRHALYAWLSLFSVLISDVYVRFFAAAVEGLRVIR